MTLKAVPKPQGHDLNDRRAQKTANAANWLPEDALYSAYDEMKDVAPVKALVVAWYVPGTKPGTVVLRRRVFCESTNDATALVADIFHGVLSE